MNFLTHLPTTIIWRRTKHHLKITNTEKYIDCQKYNFLYWSPMYFHCPFGIQLPSQVHGINGTYCSYIFGNIFHIIQTVVYTVNQCSVQRWYEESVVVRFDWQGYHASLLFKITCKKVQDGKIIDNPKKLKKKTNNSGHQDFSERFDFKLISRIAIAIIVVILAIAFAIWASTTDHGVLEWH